MKKIVANVFAIDTTSKLYTSLANQIQARNDIAAEGALEPGLTLALPDLPPGQREQAELKDKRQGVPRIQTGRSYLDVLKSVAPNLENEGAWKIFDTDRPTERLVNQWRWVTVDQARAEQASSNGGIELTVWSQPLTLKWAIAGQPSAPSGIDTDLKFLGSLLNHHKPQQQVTMFVLDDSWPSQDEFKSSCLTLLKAIDLVRTQFKFGPGGLSAALNNCTVQTTLLPTTPGHVAHASLIQGSLEKFRKLTNNVTVVYLPLFTQQTWSKDIWRELTYITLVASAMHSRLGQFGPTDDIKNQAATDAPPLVDQIPSTVVDSVGPAQQTPITVLQKFAQLQASASGLPFFISMSWTVESHEIDFGPDSDALGVSLAATGNDGKDVIHDEVYLAYRGKAAPGDVLAVMNTDGSGTLLCGSGMLPTTDPSPFFGFAYDGRFELGGAQCGTSFSTPRVAWLLALRQAYNAPIAAAQRSSWYSNLRDSLEHLQSSPASTNGRYWLAIDRLFQGL